MLKKLSFSMFDTGETILGALVFSTFFPLYITKHIDTKVYSLLYALSFGLSFIFALYLGKLADKHALRKKLFLAFGISVALLCMLISVVYSFHLLALFIFLSLSITHQQSLVFYNSLLLNFSSKGSVSGLGVALGYVGSAVALIFLAQHLKEPEVYAVVGVIFLTLLIPAGALLENPPQRSEVKLKEVFKDKRFLLLIVSILCITEVANTLIAMMGVYLREVFSMDRNDIYRVIGFSALGGVTGGIFWGYLTDRFGAQGVLWAGFGLWALFLTTLPLATESTVLLWGVSAGVLLSHVWTVSRVLILSEFPEGEASVRLSFLSLTERVASTTGLLVWSVLLFMTGDDFKLSALGMVVFPIVGALVYWFALRNG